MKSLLVAGIVGALVAVVLGAFAAHGLKQVLPAASLSTFEVGVRYQMYHSLALLLLVGLGDRLPIRLVKFGGLLFVTGIFLFSGSLYLLALTGMSWFGPVTPLGGLCFISGWLCLLAGAIKGDAHG